MKMRLQNRPLRQAKSRQKTMKKNYRNLSEKDQRKRSGLAECAERLEGRILQNKPNPNLVTPLPHQRWAADLIEDASRRHTAAHPLLGQARCDI